MKLFKNRHLVKVPQIPMLAIRSPYFWKQHAVNPEQSSILAIAFEEGYLKALTDLGIEKKHHPKGARERVVAALLAILLISSCTRSIHQPVQTEAEKDKQAHMKQMLIDLKQRQNYLRNH